jgi:hypothetical protein
MPKYIDVENIRLTVVGTVDADGDILVSVRDVKRALDQTPAADVVPKREADRLRKCLEAQDNGIKGLARDNEELKVKAKTARTEAIKEFAEALKNDLPAEYTGKIDDLEKEMTRAKDCRDCPHFLGCECFSGTPCDLLQ